MTLLLALALPAFADPPPPDTGPPPGEPAAGGGGAASIAESFQLKYWRSYEPLEDPEVYVNDYVEQINRLVASASAGSWTFTAQVDEVALFMNRYYLDDALVIERDVVVDGTPTVFPSRFDAYATVEKVRATTSGDWGSLDLGDTYVAFGRGAALNLNRNVDIDFDTSVQGAKALFRPGAWDITLVAGQINRQQVFQDFPNFDIRGDFRHLIGGVRAERFGLGPANLGAHAVMVDFVQEPGWAASFEQIGGPDAMVGGLTAELVGVGGMDFFVEGDVFGYGPDLPAAQGVPQSDLGYGVYASAAAYPGPFVLLLEGKRYFLAERINSGLGVGETPPYEIAIAPTLEYERVIVKDTSAALNSNDVWGGRLELNWAAVPGKLSPYVAGAVFRDLDLGVLHENPTPETIVHPMIGVEWIDGEYAILANAGWRVDDRDGGARTGTDQLQHGDLTFNFPLPSELAGYVALASLWFTPGPSELGFDHHPFLQAETAYSLTWAGRLTGTFSLDTTTDPLLLQEAPGNVSETLFAGGELQVKPTPDFTIKAFYGSQKAGIRCSGGQCRRVPGFSGARLALSGTF